MLGLTWNLAGISIVHLRFGIPLLRVQCAEYFIALQVLNGFRNDNGVYSLYVTDYTANSEVAACQAQWCPPGLNEYVVRFELWDDAAKQGPDFAPGSYWGVRNARMLRSSDGHVEAKLVQTKFGKLDSESDYPPLKALLEYVLRSPFRNVVSELDFTM